MRVSISALIANKLLKECVYQSSKLASPIAKSCLELSSLTKSLLSLPTIGNNMAARSTANSLASAASAAKTRNLHSATAGLQNVAFFGSNRASLTPKLVKLNHNYKAREQYSGFAARAAGTICVGEQLPEGVFSYFDSAGHCQTVKVSDLCAKGKKVVLFALPGAFTPTCSSRHLPGFVAKANELCKAGVDTLACISVNDAFVMRAWGDSLDVEDKIMMLSDGLGKFTRALGTEVDLSDKPENLGVRSRRFSMLVEDGVVTTLNLEEGGAFTRSSAQDILDTLLKKSPAKTSA